ncbi:MAG: hypothetical protein GX640_09780 [Fibrobacter sp.]|nr:hypothetical protein [Fibrobacter sp.]
MVLRITPSQTDHVHFNIRTHYSEKKKFELVLPFSFERKQFSNVYELNGATLKIDDSKKRQRIRRPVIAK